MEPLRIEFNLAGPVGPPVHPIHLDSLIAHQLVQREAPDESDVETIRAIIDRLPLERREVGGDWVWTASTIAFEWTTPPMQAMGVRQVRVEDVARHMSMGLVTGRQADAKIDTARGLLKSALFAHEYRWARRAVGYCVGNREEIRELVSGITRIGARRRLREGCVESVDVVPDEAATTLWMRRYLPEGAPGGRLMEGAYRLPLFAAENRTLVRNNALEIADLT